MVVAALEAALTPRFNFHGTHATTMGCTPCVVVTGPGAQAAEINSDLGCLGSGHRANATIGRALKLVLHRVGGARLGGSESSTLGAPSKYTFCFAENDKALSRYGPWKPYHTGLHTDLNSDPSEKDGNCFDAGDSVVTIHPTVGFTTIVDFYVAGPDELVEWIASSLVSAGWNKGFPVLSSGLLILCPEHYELLSRKFKTRKAFQVVLRLSPVSSTTVSCLLPNLPHLCSSLQSTFPLVKVALWRSCNSLMTPEIPAIVARLKCPNGGVPFYILKTIVTLVLGMLRPLLYLAGVVQSVIPKFETPESLHVVVAGAEAGKISAFCPGFGVGFKGMPSSRMSLPASVRVASSARSLQSAPPVAVPAGYIEGRSFFDPRYGYSSPPQPLAPRMGKPLGPGDVVGLLDISKGGSAEFLGRFEALLLKERPGVAVKWFTKPTFNRPAPAALREAVATGDSSSATRHACTHVAVGLAD